MCAEPPHVHSVSSFTHHSPLHSSITTIITKTVAFLHTHSHQNSTYKITATLTLHALAQLSLASLYWFEICTPQLWKSITIRTRRASFMLQKRTAPLPSTSSLSRNSRHSTFWSPRICPDRHHVLRVREGRKERSRAERHYLFLSTVAAPARRSTLSILEAPCCERRFVYWGSSSQ